LGVPLTLYLIHSNRTILIDAGAETAIKQGGYLDGVVEAAKRVASFF
jgi:monoamine oxidase